MSDQQEIRKKFIPRSIIQSSKIKGFRKRNIAEAFIFLIATEYLIIHIPFVLGVKLIVMVIFGTSVFIGAIKGIKNRSITEIIIGNHEYKMERKNYTLRSIDNAEKQTEKEINIYGNKNVIEKIICRLEEEVDKIRELRKSRKKGK